MRIGMQHEEKRNIHSWQQREQWKDLIQSKKSKGNEKYTSPMITIKFN